MWLETGIFILFTNFQWKKRYQILFIFWKMRYLNERMKEKMVQDRKNNQPGPSYFMPWRLSRRLSIKVSVGVCVCVPVNSAQVVWTWTLSSHKGKKVWKKKEKKPWSKSLIWFGSLAQGSQAFQASVYSENSWSKQHCYFNFLIKLLWFLQPTVTKAAECKTVLDIILHLCTEQHSEHTVDAQRKLVECPIL